MEFDSYNYKLIDSLLLSLLLSNQKLHKLPKTEKNNPLIDSKNTLIFFRNSLNTFGKLSHQIQNILYNLL
jgi:hypothetical protein